MQEQRTLDRDAPRRVLAHSLPQIGGQRRVEPSGFNCLVALERGTNEALDLAVLPKTGEQKLLWMKNKWLTCHPDSPQAAKGAYPGIIGENLRLNI